MANGFIWAAPNVVRVRTDIGRRRRPPYDPRSGPDIRQMDHRPQASRTGGSGAAHRHDVDPPDPLER
ncbi:MAG TPA: hypothetical protein VFL03_14500, partial [Candidatus Limnocylindrales bacterium]|nr:hypothetical protein [Candidatus Limnocylindrales bacterium]